MGAICHPMGTASLRKLARGISEFLTSDQEQSREKIKQSPKERSLHVCEILQHVFFSQKLYSNTCMLKLDIIQGVDKARQQGGWRMKNEQA